MPARRRSPTSRSSPQPHRGLGDCLGLTRAALAACTRRPAMASPSGSSRPRRRARGATCNRSRSAARPGAALSGSTDVCRARRSGERLRSSSDEPAASEVAAWQPRRGDRRQPSSRPALEPDAFARPRPGRRSLPLASWPLGHRDSESSLSAAADRARGQLRIAHRSR